MVLIWIDPNLTRGIYLSQLACDRKSARYGKHSFSFYPQGSTETKKIMMCGDIVMFFLDHRIRGPTFWASSMRDLQHNGDLAICMGNMTREQGTLC